MDLLQPKLGSVRSKPPETSGCHQIKVNSSKLIYKEQWKKYQGFNHCMEYNMHHKQYFNTQTANPNLVLSSTHCEIMNITRLPGCEQV